MWRQELPFELVALLCAKDTVGLREQAGNRGPAIEVIQRAANVSIGAPWCAAFVNWCAEYASVVKNERSPLESVEFQAYVPSYHKWAKDNGLTIPFEEVYPGSIFLKWNLDKRRWGHMGFIEYHINDGVVRQIKTVEGNSNDTGSSEGLEVVRLVRDVDVGTYAFIDWRKR